MMDIELLRTQAARLLRAHPHAASALDPLVEILQSCEPLRLHEDEVLCTEGDPGDSLYVLLRGSVRVMKFDRRGEPRELTVLQAPALIGHMSLVDGSNRSATCVGAERSEVAALRRPEYNALLARLDPAGAALRRLLLASMCQQLIRGNSQLFEIIDPDNATSPAPPAPPPDAEPITLPEDHYEVLEEQDVFDARIMRAASTFEGWADHHDAANEDSAADAAWERAMRPRGHED